MLPSTTAHSGSVVSVDQVFRSRRLTAVSIVEWGLSTQFDATDDFLKKWADAQKLNYGKGAGWIVSSYLGPFNFFPSDFFFKFWNFKIEVSTLANDTARQW